MEEIIKKIEAEKEVLSTMPRNNKKNIQKYVQKIQELKNEYQEAEDKIFIEIKKVYKNITSVEENPKINKKSAEIEELSKFLEILDTTQTSYEKMGLDKRIYKLGKFYKENLESINAEILACINEFENVGIKLTEKDFDYSVYVNDYMKTFFEERNNITSDTLKNKFESVYWQCPDLIIHIELNFRYIYLKNQKEIDKYFESKKDFVIKQTNVSSQMIIEKYEKNQRELIAYKDMDKYRIINKFLTGKLDIKDYEEDKIKQEYSKMFLKDICNVKTKKDQREMNEDSIKFLRSLIEYKNFINYKFIYEDIKKKYEQKDEHKNSYNAIRKEIVSQEKKLKKLNKKINGKGLFQKKDKKEKQTLQYNEIVKDLKEKYKKMDEEEIYQKIINNLNDESSIYDVLIFASKFNNYLTDCIIENNPSITQEEIEEVINELKQFLTDPYIIIIKNITLLENKNIAIIISDRYKLLNFNIQKDDINEENLDNLIDSLNKIKNYYEIEQAGIDINTIKFVCKADKILKAKNN